MLQLATYDPHLKVFLILHNIIQWLYRSLRYQSLYTKLAYLFPSGWASRTLWPFSTAHNACGAHSSSSLGSPTAFSELWMIMLLLGHSPLPSQTPTMPPSQDPHSPHCWSKSSTLQGSDSCLPRQSTYSHLPWAHLCHPRLGLKLFPAELYLLL